MKNFRSAMSYRLSRPERSGPALRVARDLSRDGIAIVAAAELLEPESLHAEVVRAAARLESDSAEHLAELRRSYETGRGGAQKPFSIVLEGKDAPAKGEPETERTATGAPETVRTGAA